jgi:hypothetical protein
LGVVKSLALIGSGPVGLVRTQNLQVFLKRKAHLIVVAFIGAAWLVPAHLVLPAISGTGLA